jgi:hypothetical protein
MRMVCSDVLFVLVYPFTNIKNLNFIQLYLSLSFFIIVQALLPFKTFKRYLKLDPYNSMFQVLSCSLNAVLL